MFFAAYAEGVMSYSPGLTAPAGYPGRGRDRRDFYPEDGHVRSKGLDWVRSFFVPLEGAVFLRIKGGEYGSMV